MKIFKVLSLSVGLSALVFLTPVSAQSFEELEGVPPKLAAKYIHAVIQANRTFYSKQIVDRLGKKIGLQASENWKEKGVLPLPAQFLILSSKLSKKRNVGMTYRLMSLWPVNPDNGPRNENEKTALEQVAKNPKKYFNWIVHKGDVWYYESIYPDVAVVESCVTCHNAHPKSPKTDFKVGDVMGGVSVSLPLGRLGAKWNEDQTLIPPEIVADYLYSVIESDRTIYAKHVVNRLEKKNVVHTTENWWEEDALPLPAQFLASAGKLMQKNNKDLDIRLISLWPIKKQNGPANEFERRGLETVAMHPVRPYIGQYTVGKHKYFRAVFPDFATSESCVNCHNAHPGSPKKDFQLDEVMGGISVSFPLEEK